MKISVSHPIHKEARTLTQEDVWGKVYDYRTRLHPGMIVAEGRRDDDEKPYHNMRDNVCPIRGDIVPWKSVTVVGPKALVEDIAYWLEYCHGADCIEWVQDLEVFEQPHVHFEPLVAIRSNYMCW